MFSGVFYVNASVASEALDSVTPEKLQGTAWEYISKNTEGIGSAGWYWISALIVDLWKKVMMPIILVIWLLLWIIAIYKVMFTEDEAERKKALWFFTWGLFGVLLMFSAMYIWEALVWVSGLGGIIGEDQVAARSWWNIASSIYGEILKPFVSIFMYLMIWILFIILLLSVMKILSAPDKEETVTSAKTIIIWNIFGILVILSASSLVKLVYWWEAEKTALDLWGVSADGSLETRDIGWLLNIINYFLWFLALLITVFIIYQAYTLLMKPDDEETLNALKRNFVYVLLGLLLMGWVYIIVNFIIV